MKEGFKPLANKSSNSFLLSTFNKLRRILDLQLLTIYRDAKKILPEFRGNILDVGCGDSPYRYLLNTTCTEYTGIDIGNADSFDYHNSHIIPFDGQNIPFEDNYFDAVICTEVLEHVEYFHPLIDEMFRVMKPGAKGFVTIPWSARFHYIPYDYYRYTPSSLKRMFKQFKNIAITNRGTDISVIVNKLIVLWFRNIFNINKWNFIFIPFYLLLLPVLLISITIAHLSLWFDWGSPDDPLGYTVIFYKP